MNIDYDVKYFMDSEKKRNPDKQPPVTSKVQFATPQEAEAAFYAALLKRDVEAMMAVWAEDAHIACIHPLGALSIGRAAIRESWVSIFRHSPSMKFTIKKRSHTRGGALAVHVVEEHIRVGDEPPRSPILATNAYRLTDAGWRMLLHHASPAPVPVSTKSEPRTLH